MNIQITGRRLEVTPTLKDYVESRLHKFEKYSFKIAEVQVILNVEKYRHHAEMTVSLDGTVLQAEDETEEMYSTIDRVVDKLEKQVKKYKEKITDHRIKKGAKQKVDEAFVNTSPLPVIAKEKIFRLKPVSRKEAITQMELLQKDFFVYIDEENKNINVLYRRKTGNIGLINLVY